MKPELKMNDNLEIVDISSSYNRVLGFVYTDENDTYRFRRLPFTSRLSDEEEIQLAFILDELNN